MHVISQFIYYPVGLNELFSWKYNFKINLQLIICIFCLKHRATTFSKTWDMQHITIYIHTIYFFIIIIFNYTLITIKKNPKTNSLICYMFNMLYYNVIAVWALNSVSCLIHHWSHFQHISVVVFTRLFIILFILFPHFQNNLMRTDLEIYQSCYLYNF